MTMTQADGLNIKEFDMKSMRDLFLDGIVTVVGVKFNDQPRAKEYSYYCQHRDPEVGDICTVVVRGEVIPVTVVSVNAVDPERIKDLKWVSQLLRTTHRKEGWDEPAREEVRKLKSEVSRALAKRAFINMREILGE